MLPEMVDVVGDKLTVLFDSGIRTGVDVIKALSLGAKQYLWEDLQFMVWLLEER
jgi:lactate 2-monooxygenase